MAAQKPRPILPTLLAGSGMLFILMASTCETEFPPYVQEICNDSQDNDSDGKADCQDSDCEGEAECAVAVTINQLPAADAESLLVSGTSERATTVTVTVTPSGTGGQATLETDGTWELMLRNLNRQGENHEVTAIANGASGLSDTAKATFLRNP